MENFLVKVAGNRRFLNFIQFTSNNTLKEKLIILNTGLEHTEYK